MKIKQQTETGSVYKTIQQMMIYQAKTTYTHGHNSEPIDVDAHQLADDVSEGSTKLSLDIIKLEQAMITSV